MYVRSTITIVSRNFRLLSTILRPRSISRSINQNPPFNKDSSPYTISSSRKSVRAFIRTAYVRMNRKEGLQGHDKEAFLPSTIIQFRAREKGKNCQDIFLRLRRTSLKMFNDHCLLFMILCLSPSNRQRFRIKLSKTRPCFANRSVFRSRFLTVKSKGNVKSTNYQNYRSSFPITFFI